MIATLEVAETEQPEAPQILHPHSVKDIFEAEVGTPVDPETLANLFHHNNADVRGDSTPSDMGGLDECPAMAYDVNYGGVRAHFGGWHAVITTDIHNVAAAMLNLMPAPTYK